MMPRCAASSLNMNHGAAIFTPNALTSFDRDTTQPSLLLRTTIGRPSREGSKTRSHET